MRGHTHRKKTGGARAKKEGLARAAELVDICGGDRDEEKMRRSVSRGERERERVRCGRDDGAGGGRGEEGAAREQRSACVRVRKRKKGGVDSTRLAGGGEGVGEGGLFVCGKGCAEERKA